MKRYMVKTTYTATADHPWCAGETTYWLSGRDEAGALVEIDESGKAIHSPVGVEFYVRTYGYKRRHFAEKKAADVYPERYFEKTAEVVEFDV